MGKLLFLLFFITLDCSAQNETYQNLSSVISNSFALTETENKIIPGQKLGLVNLSFNSRGIRVSILSSIGKRMSYLIYNSRGETIQANSFKLKADQNELEITLPNNMSIGYYYVQIISDKIIKRERFYYKGG